MLGWKLARNTRQFSSLFRFSQKRSLAFAPRSILNTARLPSLVASTPARQNSLFSFKDRSPFSLSRSRFFSTEAEQASAKEEIAQKPVEKVPENKEHIKGVSEKKEFQTETRKVLDIVTRSLYTEREVFVRELISNASDALEKVRHQISINKEVIDPDLPLEINIYADKTTNTLTIIDTGVGMLKNELIENLGSIGHSGSSEFIKQIENKKDIANIIGQFGVGFYSAFMVSSQVKVFSRSSQPNSIGYCWISDGTGSYEIFEADGVQRGTKIILQLNDKSHEYSLRETIEKIVKKYSNFVGFPIKLNGNPVNTVKALWTLNKNQITEAEHKEFYQFIAHAYDEPMFHLHYAVDTPLNIRSLFYIGQSHNEKFGMGRMESGVSLFSRKVMIQQKSNVLPEWLRFVKGVVDSEDIPLNISREHLQDSSLIQRIGNVLTKRIMKWLDEEAQKDSAKYEKFWNEFGNFIKEGVCMDASFKEDAAKLLRMESSHLEPGKLTSLDEYINRLPADAKEIFYLCVPSRQLAESSPYYESFKAKNKEVLFLYNTALDEFVMNHLSEYKKKKVLTIESSAAEKTLSEQEGQQEKKPEATEKIKELTNWLKETLSDRVSSVKESSRLVDSPAIVVGHGDAANFRRMMKFVDPGRAPPLPKQQLEINPNHEIIIQLNQVRTSNPSLATVVANQILDNALIAAGLMEDARSMLPRLNQILKQVTKQ